MKGIQNKQIINVLLLVVLFSEITYIWVEYKDFEIRHYQVDEYFGKIESYKVRLLFAYLCFLIAFVFLLKLIFTFDLLLLFLVLFVSLYLYLEYKIKTNHDLTDRQKNIEQIKREIQTGDFILFETPKQVASYFAFVPVVYLNINHIGVLIKDKENRVFILECNGYTEFCEYSKREKTGVALVDFEKGIRHFDDVYVVKTNLHQHIDPLQVNRFIAKYKEKNYMEDNINCITLVLLFFRDLGLIDASKFDMNQLYVDYQVLLNKEIYNIPFEYQLNRINK